MKLQLDNKLVGAATRMVKPHEADRLVRLLNRLLAPQGAPVDALEILAEVKSGSNSTAYNSLALYINRFARELSGSRSAVDRAPRIRLLLNLRERLLAVLAASAGQLPDADQSSAGDDQPGDRLAEAIVKTYQITVGRSAVAAEIEIWRNNFGHGLSFHEFFLNMGGSPEATQHRDRQAVLPTLSNGQCVQLAYEIILGRGAAAWEIEHWRDRLDDGSATRVDMLARLFEGAQAFLSALADTAPHDGLSCLIMGTGKHLTAADWKRQASAAAASPTPQPAAHAKAYLHRFHVRKEPRVLVSALASLYRGGDFIEQFMDNLTEQDGFDEQCELIIVDADSPENEYETIRRYEGRHKNIRYIRCNYRIGIYDAWNVAAKAAQGQYLTNTNMDDLRRHDSLLLQAGVLENLPFVDVVYQDLFYTFDPRLSFDEIAAFGHKTALPVITPHNMIHFNSPHNAPMWRKRLHDELGYFDTRYKSAGDYEFWMRCLAAGKKFYKINDQHVAYYQNPKGLSTRPDTRGLSEAMEVHKTYCRRLIAEHAVMPHDQYVAQLQLPTPPALQNGSQDRYSMAHHALRELARGTKYASTQGLDQR